LLRAKTAIADSQSVKTTKKKEPVRWKDSTVGGFSDSNATVVGSADLKQLA
jgi:hypothetical protein